MNIVQVLTPWIGTWAKGDSKRSQVVDDYPHIVELVPSGDTYVLSIIQEGVRKWSDITGTPSINLLPDPNLNVMQIECDDTVLAAIESDPVYFILSSEAINENSI